MEREFLLLTLAGISSIVSLVAALWQFRIETLKKRKEKTPALKITIKSDGKEVELDETEIPKNLRDALVNELDKAENNAINAKQESS